MPVNAKRKVNKNISAVGDNVIIVKVVEEREHVYTREEAAMLLKRAEHKKALLEQSLEALNNDIAELKEMLSKKSI